MIPAGSGRRRVPTGRGAYVAAVLLLLALLDAGYARWGVYRPLILGQEIYWLQSLRILHPEGPQAPRPERNAVRWLALQGPAYPAWLAAFQGVAGEGKAAARAANVPLHLGAALLVWRLGAVLVSPAAGLAALTLFALYLPGTLMATQLLTENLAAFLALLAVYLGLAGFRARGRRGTLAAGALLGPVLLAMALCRPALAPLAAVMMAAWAGAALWTGWRRRRPALLAAAALALVCGGVPYLAWQRAVTHAFGLERMTWAVAGPRSIGLSLAESYDTRNGGWPRPAAFLSARGVSLALRPAAESVRAAPGETVLLRLEKLYRLWKSPATNFANPPRGTARALVVLHAGLVVAAVVGLGLVLPAPAWVWVALPLAYTTAAYTGYFTEERRFAFPVMGLVIVAATAAVAAGAAAWARPRRRPRPRRGRREAVARGAIGAGLLLPGAWLAAPAFVLYPGQNAHAAHVAAALLFTLALGAALWRAWWALGPAPGGRLVGAAAVALVVLPVGVHLARYADWYSWTATLRNPAQRVVQEITLPPWLEWGQVARATLQVDARDRDGRLGHLAVRVNGERQWRWMRGPELPFHYRLAARNLGPPVNPGLHWRALDVAPDFPQWLVYRLDPDRLRGARRLVVTVGLDRPADGPQEYTSVAGELPGPDPDVELGPRPWLLPEDRPYLKGFPFSGRNSLWRYQTYGDMRIHGDTHLTGARRGAWVRGRGSAPAAGPGADLSDAPLRQTGGWRIRLQVITRDGVEWFL